MRKAELYFFAILSLLILSCSSGGGGANSNPTPGPTPVVAPSGLSASLIPSGFHVTWTASTGTVDGYELEAKAGAAIYQKVHTGLIPSTTTVFDYLPPTPLPEQTQVWFRVRAAAGTAFSAYSAEFSIQTPTAVPSPTGLAASLISNNPMFRITWTLPTSLVDGYELEARQDSGPFQKVHVGTLIPSQSSFDYSPLPVPPELTGFSFRVRSVRGGAFSAYSNEFALSLPLRGVSSFICSPDTANERATLTWSPNSQVATTYLLERTALDASGSPIGWQLVHSGPISEHSWTDGAFAESTAYRYRISLQTGSASSPFATVDFSGIALFRPTGLSVVPTTDGATLGWTNRSTQATQVLVQRAGGVGSYPTYTTIATLPFSTAQYTDSGLSPGFYTYRVVSQKGSSQASTPGIPMATRPDGGIPAMSSQLRDLPSGRWWASASGGTYITFSDYSSSGVWVPSGGTWTQHNPDNCLRIADPGAMVDPQGRPHLIFLRSTGGSSTIRQVIHEWFNGTSWQSEPAFSSTITSSSATEGIYCTMDGAGNIHIVYQPEDHFGNDVYYANNLAGSWSTAAVVTPGSITNLGTARISANATGTVYVALGLWNKVDLYSKDPSSMTWGFETVPTWKVNAGWYDNLQVQVFGPRVAVFYEYDDYTNPKPYQEWVVVKSSGTWSTPQMLTSRIHTGASTVSRVAGSSNGRCAIAFIMPNNVISLFRTDSGTSWSECQGPGVQSYGNFGLGFDALNKCFLIVPADGTTPNHQMVGIFSE